MRWGVVGLGLCILSGCGSGNNSAISDMGHTGGASDMGAGGRQCFGANDCPPGEMCNQFGFCVAFNPDDGGTVGDGGTPPPPPEVIVHVDPPATGKRYVYVAVPDQDTVIKIDSLGLKVQTIAVGDNPTPLRTVPGQDVALVLNQGSNDATLLRTKDDGTDDAITLASAPGLNQLTMSPDGRYALGWFDLAQSGGNLSPRQTFQDVTLFALESGKEQSVDLSVGFNPTQVKYAPDGSACYVITEDGVSIIPLTATPKAQIVPTVPVRKNALTELPPDDVVITPDGKTALARFSALSAVRAVDLTTRAITDVTLARPPTDVEITPDGKLAVAVLRAQNEVDFLPLPTALTDTTKIVPVSTGTYTAGQIVITADSASGLLFTNATTQKVMIVADLVAHTLSFYPLKKGVRNVAASPDGKAALVIHNKVPGTPSPTDSIDEYLDKLQGYSLFLISSGYAKLQPTDAEPGPYAFAADGSSGYLLLSNPADAVRSVEALDLGSFEITSVGLGSPPVSVGVVPQTAQVYVAQDHPLGRMTFVDELTFATRTLTGFGLNGQIIE